jgi:hypothetical protein
MADAEITTVAARRLTGRVLATYSAPQTSGRFGFVTQAVDALTLVYEGIPGDRHFGWTRRSGGREPWYPRGTEIRNERQVSLLAEEELRDVAQRLDIPQLRPELIGGNLLVEGLPHFSMLPASTRLTFEGGAVIAIEGQNAPCRLAGRSIAGHHPQRPDLELAFTRVAKRQRGLVGWVEKPGVIKPGATVSVRIPEQWIYPRPVR